MNTNGIYKNLNQIRLYILKVGPQQLLSFSSFSLEQAKIAILYNCDIEQSIK